MVHSGMPYALPGGATGRIRRASCFISPVQISGLCRDEDSALTRVYG